VEPSTARLTPLDSAHIAANPELWSRAERHLRAGTMPPVGAARPDRRTYEEVIAAIERELDKPEPAAETSQAIATRLATLLWNAAPDSPLREAAQRDQLRDPAVLEGQVRRMLADSRSEAFVSRFFFPGSSSTSSATPIRTSASFPTTTPLCASPFAAKRNCSF